MSNEITLFSEGNVALPDYIKHVDSNLKAATFAGAAGKSISIRGSVWRMIVDGEEVMSSDSRSLDLIIVGMSDHVGRTFYKGGYEEGKTESPICWSADGKVPDMRSAEIQSSSCDECPKNVGGSGQGDSKACRYVRTLAVVLADDPEGDVYKISLPSMSIFGKPEGTKMPLDAYRKFLKGHQIPLDCVVTEFKFDTASSTPKVIFKAKRPLTKAEFDICQAKGKSEDAVNAVTIEFAAPVKRDAKAEKAKATAAFDNEDGDDEDKKPSGFATKKPSGFAKKEEPKAEHVEAEEVVEEPKKRTKAKPAPVVEAKPDVKNVLANWADDDDDNDD